MKNNNQEKSKGPIQEIGYIKDREIVDEMKASYIDYAMSVIVSRALPDVRDGLKPVHRRILYAMNEMGLTSTVKTRKSATVVGECFIKDTMILTKNGLIPIQEIETGDQVYTQEGLKRVTQLYEMPKKPLLNVSLENGLSNIATPSQKFKILTENREFRWKEAKDLNVNDYLVIKADYPEINNLVGLSRVEESQPGYLNESIAYLLGLFVSDGWISEDYGKKKWPRIGFVAGVNKEIAIRVASIFKQEFKYAPTIETKKYSYLNKQGRVFNNEQYTLRINRKAINEFFVSNFDLEGRWALTKEIPPQIFNSPKSVIFSFISGLIEGDGCISSRRNFIHYGSISEKLINQLQVLLQCQGIFGSKYVDKNLYKSHFVLGKTIKKKHKFYYLEIRSENAVKLASKLNLAAEIKNQRAHKLASEKITSHERKGWNRYDLIPYGGKMLFQELSNNHLGAGWYQDINGSKFRMGIKYPNGECKIRYSSDLHEKPLRKNQVIDWGIEEKLKRIGSPLFNFLEHIVENKIYFLKVSSIKKAIPEKTYDFRVENDHEFIANGVVSHNCLGKYHPHSDTAVYDSLARMAQDFSLRYPLIKGQGNFGCFTKNTKIRLADGRNLSFGELIKEQKKGKRHWSFSFNHKSKKIEIAEIKNPRLTRKNEKLIEITLDNKEKIKCTLDHRFMLRNGSYKAAEDLKPGDSLMPAYFKIKSFTSWDLGIKKYYSHNQEKLLSEIDANNNHKVVRIRVLRKREDVYDLTTNPWHNFLLSAGVFVHNSVDGDPPAAQRYTECKMSKIGEETLKDINKDTVDFIDNYDGTRKEPVVLPSPLPQLLLNGSLGIAVGMATKIPPHNLSELLDAASYLIDRPKSDTEDLFKFVKGPDFPTGGAIFNRREIIETYSQGKGPIVIRGKSEIVETEGGKTQLIITEIPYQVQKSTLVKQFAELAQNKKIEGVKDIRDESDKDGMRIVMDLNKGAFAQKILNRLYKFSDLQNTYHLNMLALVDGIQPKTLSLVEVLEYFIVHRKEVIYRRVKHELKKAKERAHILEGLHKCLANIDDVIKTIKKSENRSEALRNLIKRFKLTEIQANAILETKLSALAKLERKKIEDELKEIKAKIKEYTAILKDPKKIKIILKKEFEELKNTFGDERRTKVYVQKIGGFAEEDLIPQEETIITLTQGGYIKRVNPSLYKKQKRGGKGFLGLRTVGEDIVEHFLWAQTHDQLLFFTDSGKVFQVPAYEIPEGTRVAKGRGLLNFLEISSNEKVLTLFSLGSKNHDEGVKYLVMATKDGIIKKTSLEEFKNVRRSGLIAISLKKGDVLRKVAKTSGEDDIVLITKKGQSIRFKEKDIRAMGRAAAGNKGIRLKQGDEVIGMEIVKAEETRASKEKKEKAGKFGRYLLVVAENGYGKRTEVKEFKSQGRGGSGIRAARVTPKTGNLVSTKVLTEQEDLIVISQKGHVIRVKIDSISRLGRATQGVRIMKIDKDDKVASAICI